MPRAQLKDLLIMTTPRQEGAPDAVPQDAKRSLQSSILTFAQTSLGMFLLGSVLLPLCVAGHTWFKVYRADKLAAGIRAAEEKNYIERLDFEISYRYSKTIGRLKTLAAQVGTSSENLKLAMQPLTASADVKNNPPLYLEFNSLSGYALMAELRRKLPEWQFNGNPLPGTVGYAMTSLSDLEASLDNKSTTPLGVATVLTSIMNRPGISEQRPRRWDKGFSWTGCIAPDRPFC